METSLQSIKTYLENGLVDCSTSFFILYCIVRCNNTTYLYRSSTCLDVSFNFILGYSRGFLGLCYYIVTGGFRVVAGIGFFGIVIPSILIFTFFILCSMQISRIYFHCTAFIPRNYERKYV